MNCVQCINWALAKSPMRAHSFGMCKADPDKLLATGRTFSGSNLCRFSKFAQAPASTVARRMAELQR